MRPSVSGAVVLAAAMTVAGCGSTLPLPLGPQAVLTARDVALVEPGLQIPAGRQATVVVDNQDAGVPHGFSIQAANGQDLFTGQIVAGPARTSYVVPPLAPGGYLFLCPVHPMMQGKLVVG